jgi:dipeptidyl aminopeptidase/acylaminoacyl peptidase
MKEDNIVQDSFLLESEGLHLRVFTTMHAGGGYETIYDHMAADLAQRGFVGITMIHRGYPGSEGRMEYGLGEITDIGNLTRKILSNPAVDGDRMGIMGYSRGAHNALLAIEKYDYFKAGARAAGD